MKKKPRYIITESSRKHVFAYTTEIHNMDDIRQADVTKIINRFFESGDIRNVLADKPKEN